MNRKHPPEWLVNHLVVEAFEFVQDIDKWEYQNSYYEMPVSMNCPHCAQSVVKLYSVVNDGGDTYAFGQCNKCRRVYWTEYNRS